MGVEKIERQIADDLKSFGGAGVIIHEPDVNKKDMIGDLKKAPIEDEESYGEEMEENQEDVNDFEKLAEDYKNTNLNPEVLKAQERVISNLDKESTVTEKFDMDAIKRTGKGLAAAAGLAGAVAAGSHLAPKAYQAGKEVAGEIMSTGGTKDFLARIDDEADRKRVINSLAELRDMGTEAALRPSSMLDDLERKRREFSQLEKEMRVKYNISNKIYLQENVELTTAGYLTEQVKSDSVRRSSTEKNLSFKERYKPKTSFQLEELRRYGL